ncbi:hypothetical protein M0813_18774 [Anaeramoeba flamelloides]|uniref:Uncharacterized protein n=1 Tax=Anaeramoeba flamelloides TaxID=1746091 RepID=A0ABQ8YRJ7_9EUKA|nr:hypothetical protein M0813_18774 [Anaeramoeba flamelloides]
MSINFYPLLWQYGKYLSHHTKPEELFRVDHQQSNFIAECIPEETKSESGSQMKRKLDLIQSLFIQNGAFVHPQTKKKSSSNVKGSQECKRFYLSHVWSELFQNNTTQEFGSEDKEKKKKKPQKSNVENSRTNRTIGILGFKIMSLLKTMPYNRDDLSLLTEFTKQRICMVISIYKIINLVTEDPKTNLLYWNTEQASLIPDINGYLKDLLVAKNMKRLLAQRVMKLSTRLIEKISIKRQKHGHNSTQKNLNEKILCVIRNNIKPSLIEKVKIEQSVIKKITVQEILERLSQHKKKLVEFKEKKVKFEFQKSNFKIPNSYSCGNLKLSKKRKLKTLNNKKKNKYKKKKKTKKKNIKLTF